MKAVIPCAVKEDSLFPFTESKPTGMLPVMGKPIVKHLISDLQEHGVDDIYIVTNYREEQFQEEFDEYTNVNLVTQKELNGTGGALETCSFIEEDFVVVNGDVIVSERDIGSLLEKHEQAGSAATLLATDDDQPEKFGVLGIQNDRVEKLEEKPEEPDNTLVNTGIYVFTSEIFDILEEMEDDEKWLSDAVEQLVKGSDVRFEMVKDYWIDIGGLKRLWKADRVKREYEIEDTEIHEDAEVHESVEIEGDAVIEKGAVVKPNTTIEGKVFIGRNCVVGPNATVKDSTLTRSSQVYSADVEDSLLFERSIVDPSTYIEQSVIGEESDIKSNTVIRESFIGPRSFVEMNNSIRAVKFVPDARTDLGEISK
jgi:bifunctional UDP-N-acetylglucosamine pyrophosphorylase/glucosamine-1-phosphate N-acetyltransferase